MWRWLFFLIVLCLIVVGVVWVVQNPGDVTLQWRSWRIDTSVGVLIGAVAVVSIIVAAIYRFWRFLRRVPGEIGNSLMHRRQRKGYEALGSGMVAIAAGDRAEARRNARRAEHLLSDSTPLTRLLAAQAAQLEGDEQAAERFFTEMLEDPETRFLGLRGLLTQALKANERGRALELAKEAHAMKPTSEWVAATLFELQSGARLWVEAEATNDGMVRNRLVDKSDAERRRAVLVFAQARTEDKAADRGETLKQLKAAVNDAPDLIPAVVALMHHYIADGQQRKAATLAEKTWAKMPHPDLVEPYWESKKATDALAKVKATEQLVAADKAHLESRIAMARAAMDAELWGEARKYLRDAGVGEGLEPPARVCRMMAELEERENQDLTTAREWLVRAAGAPADPRWVCDHCGNAVDVWTAHCGNCKSFDSFAWRAPTRISGLIAPLDGGDEGTDSVPAIADSSFAPVPVKP